MGHEERILITLTDGEQLLKVALKAVLSEDCVKYYLEPENKKEILDLLPLHTKNGFELVEVIKIFEVVIN